MGSKKIIDTFKYLNRKIYLTCYPARTAFWKLKKDGYEKNELRQFEIIFYITRYFMALLFTFISANHNKDHSVMISTSLDVFRGIFICTNSTLNFSI